MHHGVRIQDSALVAAAVLSDRYVTGRFLPDKAIDLIDEAASRLRIEIDSMPVEIDEVERRIRQLEIEQAALQKETDSASQDRLERLERGARRPERTEPADEGALGARERVDRLRSARRRSRSRSARMEAERAEREGDLQRVAEIRYGTLRRAREGARGTDNADARRAATRPEDAATRRSPRKTSPRSWRKLDRHPGDAPAGRRDAEARRGSRSTCTERVVGQDEAVDAVAERDPPVARRAAGSEPADRIVPVPRTDRRREDRAGARAGRVPVR